MRLNIGCGRDVREGWINVDCLALAPEVCVWSLTNRWPVADGEVEEIMASHVMEHFTLGQRCFVYNEMHRVMQPGGKATVIVPHWANARAYGDPTHEWPPVSEFSWYYLGRAWRDEHAPHTNEMLRCDFDATWGYAVATHIQTRNTEFQQFAINHYANAIVDIHATLIRRA